MKKIETTIETVVADISAFYNASEWHFVTANGVDLGDGMEMQYFFARYNTVEDVVCYFFKMDYNQEAPSLVSIIPPAYLGEGETVDMFGIAIKDIAKGLFLDEDSIQAPLRKTHD